MQVIYALTMEAYGKMKNCVRIKALLGCIVLILSSAALGDAESPEIAVIRPKARTGFANAGWKYDRYEQLQSLDAHTRMVVADLEGPGVIRHIHTTRHHPKELFTRGIVLEIWFDYATVFYCYQTEPGGYNHEPLPAVSDRQKVMLRPE